MKFKIVAVSDIKVIPSFIKIVPRDLELKHAEVDTISPVGTVCFVLDP
jgi:hypothetical protein